jgi:hypothetical protein
MARKATQGCWTHQRYEHYWKDKLARWLERSSTSELIVMFASYDILLSLTPQLHGSPAKPIIFPYSFHYSTQGSPLFTIIPSND